MAAGASNFAKLLELARETSSEKRRELLRQVTDAFITPRAPQRAHLEADLFDEFVTTIAHDLEEAVRVELSEKIASVDLPVNRTARRLAMDSIAVGPHGAGSSGSHQPEDPGSYDGGNPPT